MYELLKRNGLRLVVEPDIYDVPEGLGSFLEKNNLSIVVTIPSSPMLQQEFMAELSKRLNFVVDDESGVKIKNGMKTNTQYYITPDITPHPFKSNDSYNGDRKVGIGKDIKSAITNLLSEIKEMYLIVETQNSVYNFVKIPSIFV